MPTAKRIGKELLKQSIPEILDVVGSKKSPKEAFKNTIAKTVKKQTGGSRRNTSRRRKSSQSKPQKAINKRKKSISTHRAPKRSRADFFLPDSTMIANMLRSEATHSSLDLFEKPSLSVIFDGSFCQKLGPSYSPNGPMLEFEVAGDRNNFIDLLTENFLGGKI